MTESVGNNENLNDFGTTFCTPLKICQKWAHFIRKFKLYKFIENTLKIDYNGRNFNIVEKGKKNCLWRVS
jgi:hypothetical protein